MSTVDSLLLLASSAVVRDIVQKAMGIRASERTLSNLARGVTVLIGVVGLVVALTEPASIFYFVLFAWSGIACAFTPVVLCSLFWKRTTKLGAIAGMIGGFVVTVVWTIWFKERFYDLYEMIPGFIAGFVCTISVSLMTECDRDIADEVDSVRRAVGPVF